MNQLRRLNRGLLARFAACAGVLVTAVTIAATGVAPAASAAVATPARSQAPATAHALAVSGPVVQVTATSASARIKVIICRMRWIGANGGRPHHSGHVPGTVNVRVGVRCANVADVPVPVPSIKGKVSLASDSNGVKIRPFGSTNSATAKGNAALKCVPGYYVGEAQATVTFPAGYTPHTGTLESTSPEAYIGTC